MSDLSSLLKKHKIKNIFSYYEERVSDKEVRFGWSDSSSDNLSLPIVISYGSKSKSISEEDLDWSKRAGSNAATLSDYVRYFKALTGDTASSFLEKWSGKTDELEEVRKNSNPNYREGEGKFIISLANLIDNGGKFSQYGRIFKVISE